MARRTSAAKARRKKNETAERGRSNHVTYRELRNTPGKVWERLQADQPLTLMAGGEPKALLIPIPDGDPSAAQEAYVRGRALMAVRQLQDEARRTGKSSMTIEEINELIRAARRTLRDREDPGG